MFGGGIVQQHAVAVSEPALTQWLNEEQRGAAPAQPVQE